ncbi:MAG: UDP-N-acetylglucosamine--N-acetylmuramyl-(pentapeptide) pyrophosphoryl-undecaprenol N-acetylglucosamine transferase [Candidatus Erginobacter occultus]|nr:UDP-N-acetylglucosamine--N-acetylmuramyl-(pentapeptide) pyrophosphoryl-undecaprenol N-acetylglucosamine transferase [Candidatus Erginobacter occultus]
MNLVFAGGGTGGHLAPAIALLEELRSRDDDSGGLFLTAGGPAEALARSAPGSRVISIPSAAISPVRPWRLPARLLTIRRGYRRSLKVLEKQRPDLVIGLGGYVSLPPVLAARRLKIPAVCHEQNRVLGRANRFLARGPVRVIASFPLLPGRFDPSRVVRLGAPVRRAALEAAPENTAAAWGLEPGKFTVLVLGGSRGARAINRMLEAASGCWSGSGEAREIQLIHCAGPEDRRRLESAYRQRGVTAVVFAGLEKIGWAYSLADLAVSRAGGATLSELAAWGLPALLIPYPFATDDHQQENARYFGEASAAVVHPEREITAPLLAREISRFRSRPQLRERMAASARGLHTPGAAKQIIDYLRNLADNYA